MDKLELIKMAIKEWDGDDSKAIQTCWNIAIVIGTQEPSLEQIKWMEETIKEQEK